MVFDQFILILHQCIFNVFMIDISNLQVFEFDREIKSKHLTNFHTVPPTAKCWHEKKLREMVSQKGQFCELRTVSIYQLKKYFFDRVKQ